MAVRRVRIDDRVPPSRRRAQRDLERDEQARTLWVQGNGEPRISPADEQEVTDAVRQREQAEARQCAREQNARLDREYTNVQLAVGRFADSLEDRNQRTRKQLQRIRKDLQEIRDRHIRPV
jgi:hypothetical protein